MGEVNNSRVAVDSLTTVLSDILISDEILTESSNRVELESVELDLDSAAIDHVTTVVSWAGPGNVNALVIASQGSVRVGWSGWAGTNLEGRGGRDRRLTDRISSSACHGVRATINKVGTNTSVGKIVLSKRVINAGSDNLIRETNGRTGDLTEVRRE